MASVRERTSATSESTWAVLYRHGRRQSSRTFPTYEEAGEFAAMVNRHGAERALKWLADDDPTSSSGITVDEIAQAYLARRKAKVAQRTWADYVRDYTNWVEPHFGHRTASEVDESDVQGWVDGMERKLSPKSVAGRHQLLYAIYEYGSARSRSLVDFNPCKETELPEPVKRAPKGTTVSEWRALLAAAEKRNADAGDLILFMGSTGWRWSEAAALAVRDVEDDGERIFVNVTQVFRIVENRQVLVPDTAKTFAGFRRVEVLSSDARTMLRRRVVGKGPGDYVFLNSKGRHWNQNTFLRDTWPALLTNAKVGDRDRKPTPHWLRHMAVGILHAAGVDALELRRYLGHRDLATTAGTYGGMLGGVTPEAAARADLIMSGRGGHGMVVAGQVVRELSGAVLDPDE